jgi:small nuclear ribonucleoprotein (snRNP)-like protein
MVMTVKLATLILILVTALGHSPVAAAQDVTVDRDWAAVIALPPGTRLSVKMKTGETVKGKISSVSGSVLTLLEGNSLIDLERARIKKVYRVGGRQVGKSTLIGLGIGTGTGVAIGSVVAATDGPSESGEGHLPIVVFGAGGAIIGTATGLVTGLFSRKKVLIYESK